MMIGVWWSLKSEKHGEISLLKFHGRNPGTFSSETELVVFFIEKFLKL